MISPTFIDKSLMLNYVKMSIVISCCFCNLSSNAQCIASGPRSPTITANDASIGSIGWSNVGNAMASDNSRATATSTLVVLGGQHSNYLVTTGYGFSIPATATVCGIHVEVENSASAFLLPTAYVEDNQVRIVKGGTIYPTDIISGVNWGSNDGIDDHGDDSEAWGTTWTPAEVNASDFGVAVSAKLVSIASLFPTARIDHVRITVYYDEFLPIDLLDLSAKRINDEFVAVSWTPAVPSNGAFLTLEYSSNGQSEWEAIETIRSDRERAYKVLHQYSSETNQSAYYRVKKTGLDGVVDYSSIIAYTNGEKTLSNVKVYPIPTKGKFTIESNDEIQKVEVINVFGKIVYQSSLKGKMFSVDIGTYSPMEVFFVKAYIGDKVEVKKIVME